MEYIGAFIAFLVKSIWGLILFIIIITIVLTLVIKKRAGKENKFGVFNGIKLGVIIMLIPFSITFCMIFGGAITRAIVNKYGITTTAVMYKISDPSIMINDRDVYRYHFIFQLPDSTYREASILGHHMKRRYSVNQTAKVKYLLPTASYYPIMIDVNE